MKLTLELFRATLESNPASRYVIAFSGGLDSSVLLHLCTSLNQVGIIPDPIAIHINHGLQREAESWDCHCRDVCESFSIPYRSISVNARANPGESPEDAARKARYRAFEGLMTNQDVLLTAHHQDDQAETVLLRLFRGAGVQGLAGIAESTNFGRGRLVRPLLRFNKQSLEEFARSENLRWIEDSSNSDPRFDRNFLRQHIIPVLKNRWPNIDKTISRSAGHCGEAKLLLELRADEFLNRVHRKNRNTLRIDRLKLLDDADKRLVLRQWINRSGYKMPTTILIHRILNETINAMVDRNPRICWADAEINRYRNEMYLFPRQGKFDRSRVIKWSGGQNLDMPQNFGSLQIIRKAGIGISEKQWNAGVVTVKFRQGGETLRLINRQGNHTLKKLFQEKSIPPWVRNRIPLIYINEKLAAVADCWVSKGFAGESDGNNIRLRWVGCDLGWKSGDSGHDVV